MSALRQSIATPEAILDDAGRLVAVASDRDLGLSLAEVNAAELVRRWNAHEDLLAELSEIVEEFEGDDMQTATELGVDAWLIRARAAIAKARGTK